MLYDVLRDFGEYFRARDFFQSRTTETYKNRLEHLLEGQSVLNTLDNLDISKMISNLEKIKYKNDFSQSKNALLKFLEWQNIKVDSDNMNRITELEKQTHKRHRRLNESSLKKMNRTITHMKNKKFRLSYQTLIETGLRVSEVSQVKTDNCHITDTEIKFTFTGKGGERQTTTITKEENSKLYQELSELYQTTKQGKSLFYCEKYLQKKAKESGFQCHDLRRASAKIEYQQTKSKKAVQEKLRHKDPKTTESYLKSKVKVNEEV